VRYIGGKTTARGNDLQIKTLVSENVSAGRIEGQVIMMIARPSYIIASKEVISRPTIGINLD
jgi:hypothetical protein